MADDDDFAFDFEGNLQKEAETYQGASVSGEGDFLLLRVSLSLSLSLSASDLNASFPSLSRFSLSLPLSSNSLPRQTGGTRRTRPARGPGNAAGTVAHQLQEELPTGEWDDSLFLRFFFSFNLNLDLLFFSSSLSHLRAISHHKNTPKPQNRRSAPTG